MERLSALREISEISKNVTPHPRTYPFDSFFGNSVEIHQPIW